AGAAVAPLEAGVGFGAALAIGPPALTLAGPVTALCSLVPAGGLASRFAGFDTGSVFSIFARNCSGGFDCVGTSRADFLSAASFEGRLEAGFCSGCARTSEGF